jgi:hypothetical protein
VSQQKHSLFNPGTNSMSALYSNNSGNSNNNNNNNQHDQLNDINDGYNYTNNMTRSQKKKSQQQQQQQQSHSLPQYRSSPLSSSLPSMLDGLSLTPLSDTVAGSAPRSSRRLTREGNASTEPSLWDRPEGVRSNSPAKGNNGRSNNNGNNASTRAAQVVYGCLLVVCCVVSC